MADAGTTIFNRKYELLHKLGEGGFAAVYLAKDITLARQVAIKILNPQLSEKSPTFLKRFEQEAQTVARLSHANIIGVYEFGQEEGRYFIVMPYLPGPDLAQLLIRQGALAVDQVLRITRQVGEALDYAHSRGIVHRDVKPPNVIFNEHGSAMLTDFGIVKLADNTTQLTRTGGVIGTPYYMAPEQWSGGKVDGRTDLYALGVIAYQMLTGQIPFAGDTPPRIMYSHLNETPPPPHEINPALPPAVEQVFLKVLAKSSQERYPTAAQFYADLEAALKNGLSDETILGDRGSGAVTTSGLPKAAWAGIAALLLIALAAGVFLLWPGGDAPTPATGPTVQEAVIAIDDETLEAGDDFQQVACDTSRRIEITFLDGAGEPVQAANFSYNWRFEPDDPHNDDKINSGNYVTNYHVPCELDNQTVIIEAQRDGKTFFTKSLLFDIEQ